MPVNYEVLHDPNLTIQMGAGRTIDFDLPTNAVIDDRKKAPIVSFMLNYAAILPDPANPTNSQNWKVELAVEVNDRRISAYTFKIAEGGTERVIQEAMDPNNGRRRLNHGRNTLHFEIDGGYGMVSVQDIVIWYHTS